MCFVRVYCIQCRRQYSVVKMDFKHIRLEAGFGSRSALADYLKVNVSTVTRWENNDTVPPYHVVELLRLLGGHLPTVGRRQNWADWKFSGDYLYTPEGERFTPGDIRTIPNMHQRMAAYRSEIRRLESKVDKLEAEQRAIPDNVVQFPAQKRS